MEQLWLNAGNFPLLFLPSSFYGGLHLRARTMRKMGWNAQTPGGFAATPFLKGSVIFALLAGFSGDGERGSRYIPTSRRFSRIACYGG
jgi:hypothetical protein